MIVFCSACEKKYKLDDSKRRAFEEKPARCPECDLALQIEPGEALEKTLVGLTAAASKSAAVEGKDKLPASIGPYVVDSLLGRGGMGCVYKAWDESLRRHVAVKVLAPNYCEDKHYRRRFLTEARALAKLVHPNITQIYSADEEGNQPYFAMEYIVGQSTEQLLAEKGTFDVSEALRIVKQVCLGLNHAQQKGITHRDIKPANILLSDENEVKITDFGIAKVMDDDKSLTKTGMMIGTPAYISPEQAKGDELDFRSDIYSLGVTLYEYLLGRPPFVAGSNMTVIVKHISEVVQFPVLPNVAPIPPPLTGVIRKMLAKNPTRRYLSYEQLLNDLNDFEQKSLDERKQQATAVNEASRLTGMTTVYQPVVAAAEEQRAANVKKMLLLLTLAVLAGLAYWQWPGQGQSSAINNEVAAANSKPEIRVNQSAIPSIREAEQSLPVAEVTAAETNVLVEQIGEDGYRIFGTVRNSSNAAMHNILVTVTVIDDFQEELQKKTSSTDPGRILPGEAARFSTLFQGINSLDQYRVRVDAAMEPELQ